MKLKYIAQVNISPPKFNIFSNFPDSLNNHYKRFISNKLKKEFNLKGLPIKIFFKKLIILMKKISFALFIIICSNCFSDENKINIIVENCMACHNVNMNIKEIPYIYDLPKIKFIELMINYKKQKDNNVMSRINRVLSEDDIRKIADLLYD